MIMRTEIISVLFVLLNENFQISFYRKEILSLLRFKKPSLAENKDKRGIRKQRGRKFQFFRSDRGRRARWSGELRQFRKRLSRLWGQGGHPRLDYPSWRQTEPRLIATPFLQMHTAGMPLAWKRGSCPSCTFFDSIRYSYFSPVSNEENDGGRLVDQRHHGSIQEDEAGHRLTFSARASLVTRLRFIVTILLFGVKSNRCLWPPPLPPSRQIIGVIRIETFPENLFTRLTSFSSSSFFFFTSPVIVI